MGAVMGGVYFTLADFALAVASNWQEMGNVSLNSEITYLTAAKGDVLTAEAFCVKNGRTTGYYRIDVKDGCGNLATAWQRSNKSRRRLLWQSQKFISQTCVPFRGRIFRRSFKS